MARLPRVVIAGVAHHVTQRGNGRQFILGSDTERRVYLDLLAEAVKLYGVSVVGYCLMPNHVHLVVIPRRAEGLAEALKRVHGRYASYWNVAQASSGHVWQGRFYSCPLEEGHWWRALRYTELNPVRGGLAREAAEWAWSSAGAHCGRAEPAPFLDMADWGKRWNPDSWRKFLGEGESDAELQALRRCTHTGRPLGSPEFVGSLERQTRRRLAPQKGGRPRKPTRRPRR